MGWGEEQYDSIMGGAAAHERIAELERRVMQAPLRGQSGGGGGGGVSVTWVAVLPAIPTTPKTVKYVVWMNSTTDPSGTGNNGLWTAKTGDTAWKCIDKLTDLSGVPV